MTPLEDILGQLQERSALKNVEQAARDGHQSLSDVIANEVERLVGEKVAADTTAASEAKKSTERAGQKKTGLGRFLARHKGPAQVQAESRSRQLSAEIRSIPGVASVIQSQERRSREERVKNALKNAGYSEKDAASMVYAGQLSQESQIDLAGKKATAQAKAAQDVQNQWYEQIFGHDWQKKVAEIKTAQSELQLAQAEHYRSDPQLTAAQKEAQRLEQKALVDQLNYRSGLDKNKPTGLAPANMIYAWTNGLRDDDVKEFNRKVATRIFAQYAKTTDTKFNTQMNSTLSTASDSYAVIQRNSSFLQLPAGKTLKQVIRETEFEVMGADSPQGLANLLATNWVVGGVDDPATVYHAILEYDDASGNKLIPEGEDAHDAVLYAVLFIRSETEKLRAALFGQNPLAAATLTPTQVQNDPAAREVYSYTMDQFSRLFDSIQTGSPNLQSLDVWLKNLAKQRKESAAALSRLGGGE